MSKLVLGGGCFWCIEGILKKIRGVKTAISGYAGGNLKNPSYKEVCSGNTGHVEVVEVTYDDTIISDYKLIKSFLLIHDPTTLNRQGHDVGSHYKSVIFYDNEIQKEVIFKVIEEMNKEVYDGKIVTKIFKLEEFYKAEDHHQDFFDKNPEQAYCQYVITPKLNKFRKNFLDLFDE